MAGFREKNFLRSHENFALALRFQDALVEDLNLLYDLFVLGRLRRLHVES